MIQHSEFWNRAAAHVYESLELHALGVRSLYSAERRSGRRSRRVGALHALDSHARPGGDNCRPRGPRHLLTRCSALAPVVLTRSLQHAKSVLLAQAALYLWIHLTAAKHCRRQ